MRAVATLHAAQLRELTSGAREVFHPAACLSAAYLQVAGPGGEQWTFPCASWLGKSDAGGDDLAGGALALGQDASSLSALGVVVDWLAAATKEGKAKLWYAWGLV